MTGSSVTLLIIPIAGTLFLAAWLAVVFYAGHRLRGAAGLPAPGHGSPGQAALAAPLLAGTFPMVLAGPPDTRHCTPRQDGNLHVIFEVER